MHLKCSDGEWTCSRFHVLMADLCTNLQEGETALHRAAALGRLDVVKLLLNDVVTTASKQVSAETNVGYNGHAWSTAWGVEARRSGGMHASGAHALRLVSRSPVLP
jgi:hypothetical protein